MPSGLLISVGGSPQPILRSIHDFKPEYVMYFVSRETRCIVRGKVEPALLYRPTDHEILVTPNGEDLYASVVTLMRRVPELLEQWQIGYDDLRVDYTGGTKPMAAAMALALHDRVSNYSYVGGRSRDKDGLGVVQNGHEEIITVQNPWDVLAVKALRNCILLYRNHHFLPAAEEAKEAASKTNRLASLFTALADLAVGCYAWDTFRHKEAKQRLNKARAAFDKMACVESCGIFGKVVSELDDCIFFLDTVCLQLEGKGGGENLIKDIIANAIRRADDGYHYDDAVSRLYSAIEKAAKVRLQVQYGINNGDVDLSRILDEQLRGELEQQCRDARDGRVKLPLHKSYSLLSQLGDPLGQKYVENSETLHNLLNVRNDSLLAHGFKPVKQETFETMLAVTLDFIGAGRADLPRFPELREDRFETLLWG